jgi:hypothetical protein
LRSIDNALTSVRAGIEDREFTEHFCGPHDRLQVIASVGAATAELDLAGGDDVELVTGLAFGVH